MGDIQLPCWKNLTRISEGFAAYPPDWQPKNPLPGDVYGAAGKRRRTQWLQKADTNWLIMGGISGQDPLQRVGKDNPPRLLHGFLFDFDVEPLDSEVRRPLDAGRCVWKPTFLAKSLSGRLHAAWMLEHPIPIRDERVATAIYEAFVKENKVADLFAGLDPAYKNPAQVLTYSTELYYHERANVVPEAAAYALLEAALRKVDAAGDGDIPLEMVHAEFKRRCSLSSEDKDFFPGGAYLPKQFVVGLKMPRIWAYGKDGSPADNPNGAMICPRGCFVLSGGEYAFKTWSNILGDMWYRSAKAEARGKAISGIWYCDGNYFYKRADGEWQQDSTIECRAYLASQRGLSTSIPKGSDMKVSPVDDAIGFIKENITVHDVGPMVYKPEGVTLIDGGRRVLNTCNLRVMDPRGEIAVWDSPSWAWIRGLLVHLFPHSGDPDYPVNPITGVQSDQLDYFLSWASYAYRNAYLRDPQQGQIAILVGEVGVGKSALSEILGAAFGGGEESAGAWISGETQWNSQLFSKGFWVLGDMDDLSHKSRGIYAATLKRLAAVTRHAVNKKFKTTTVAHWAGRVIISMNSDASSLDRLPDISGSIVDKICAFKCGKTPESYFDMHCKRKSAKELSYFCSVLRDWPIPDAVNKCGRFGIKAFWHPELYDDARQVSESMVGEDVVMVWLNRYFSATQDTEFSGSATQIVESMNRMLIDKVIPQNFTRRVGRILRGMQQNKMPIQYAKGHNGTRVWTISKTICKKSCPELED